MKLESRLKNLLIIDIIRVLDATYAIYWKLYKLSDLELFEVYKILVLREERRCSVDNIIL